MKAIAKKIKDNEWIAEWGNPNFRRCPISAIWDIKYLEENEMDGKEVEGKTSLYVKDQMVYFQLTTPPIHSDPAGEDALTEIIKKHCTSRDGFNYTFSTIGIMIAAKEIYKASPMPQTGRTYTEEEVIGFAEWLEQGYHQEAGVNGIWYDSYAHHHKNTWKTSELFKEYLNQKP